MTPKGVHALIIGSQIGTHSLYPPLIGPLSMRGTVDMFSVIFNNLKPIKKCTR